jgi:hypothetical protein
MRYLNVYCVIGMSFPSPFPLPFPSPFPRDQPLGLTTQAKLDFCMQKIMELECRIRQLESKPLVLTSVAKKQSLD